MENQKFISFASTRFLDVAFKHIFTQTANHIVFLKDLVGSILDIPFADIKELTIENSEVAPEKENGKLCRLDLLLKVNDFQVDIELQFGHRENYFNRSLYYLSRLLDSSLKSGDDYGKLVPSIGISIIDFNLFPNKSMSVQTRKYHHSYQLVEISDIFERSRLLRWIFWNCVRYLNLLK